MTEIPYGVWLKAGTPVTESYPCRCREERAPWAKECNPAFCPCPGRTDPQRPDCCAHRYSAQDAAQAYQEWERRKGR